MSRFRPPDRKSNGVNASSSTRDAPFIVDSDEEDEKVINGYSHNAYRPVIPQKRARGSISAEIGSKEGGIGGKEAIRVELTKLDAEINDVRDQLEPLQQLLRSLEAERRQLESQLSFSSHATTSSSQKSDARTSNSKKHTIDYQTASFPWTPQLLPLAKRTFNIPSFRLCQEGVINAAIDGRDIVCVMPTGGGKSLTYQLPAIIGNGLTVVISPLLALIWDQVRALKEIGVECAMLTGTTSTAEQNEIYRRMQDGDRPGKKEIRLCYLTPEKVSKSKRLLSVLEKVYSDGRLKRFVIDFRPDYKQLTTLKRLFPRTPIQAVTATLSSKTLPDLLKILLLKPVVSGREATSDGTVFFTAPLYRPNLRYQVLPKPGSSKAVIEAIGAWVVENHPGIIYCLSKKDAEDVAQALRTWSNGDIKTGVYHAGMEEYEKERIHVQWREGKVNCICATIAFGLGIDKGDVRYVIHHSMSKSLDGYYQETGRAGRDGKDSDCVLFYRGQDMARMMGLVFKDTEGIGKLREMVRYAQDLKTCRKILFAKYFSTSAKLSANAWDNPANLSAPTATATATTSASVSGFSSGPATTSSSAGIPGGNPKQAYSGGAGGTLVTCGTCDNCTRDPETMITRDVTLDSWRIIKVSEHVQAQGGRLTAAALGDLARGLGGGSFAVQGGRKGRDVGKEEIDLDEVVGGKVGLNKEDTETLIVDLILTGYLAESLTATAYSVNVYIIPAQKSIRLSRLPFDAIEIGAGPALDCTFVAPPSKKKRQSAGGGVKEQKAKGKGKKGKQEIVEISDGEESDVGDGNIKPEIDVGMGELKSKKGAIASVRGAKTNTKKRKMEVELIDDEDEVDDDDDEEDHDGHVSEPGHWDGEDDDVYDDYDDDYDHAD